MLTKKEREMYDAHIDELLAMGRQARWFPFDESCFEVLINLDNGTQAGLFQIGYCIKYLYEYRMTGELSEEGQDFFNRGGFERMVFNKFKDAFERADLSVIYKIVGGRKGFEEKMKKQNGPNDSGDVPPTVF